MTDPLISTLAILGLMAAVVLLFRVFIRRPTAVSQEDAPGVRTIVVFAGNDPQFFQLDKQDELLVGVRLFEMLCDGLSGGPIVVEDRGRIQNAHRAYCTVGPDRFALVLEWIDRRWVVSIEWVPTSSAEKRHLALTQQVFAPPDSRALRQLLAALDGWLKANSKLSDVAWHRKEKWIAEDTSDASDWPVGAKTGDL